MVDFRKPSGLCFPHVLDLYCVTTSDGPLLCYLVAWNVFVMRFAHLLPVFFLCSVSFFTWGQESEEKNEGIFSAFKRAVIAGDVTSVEKSVTVLHAAQLSIDTPLSERKTAMILAAENGHLKVVAYLVRAGASLQPISKRDKQKEARRVVHVFDHLSKRDKRTDLGKFLRIEKKWRRADGKRLFHMPPFVTWLMVSGGTIGGTLAGFVPGAIVGGAVLTPFIEGPSAFPVAVAAGGVMGMPLGGGTAAWYMGGWGGLAGYAIGMVGGLPLGVFPALIFSATGSGLAALLVHNQQQHMRKEIIDAFLVR